MAAGVSEGDGVRWLRRTITGVADLSGRSRRMEVFCYWLASIMVTVTLSLAVHFVLPLGALIPFDYALKLLVVIPTFALFVRRLHDQGRSGWWGLLWPACLLFSAPDIWARLHGEIGTIITARSGIPAAICTLAVFILCLLPGTIGENRYGPDPRLEAA